MQMVRDAAAQVYQDQGRQGLSGDGRCMAMNSGDGQGRDRRYLLVFQQVTKTISLAHDPRQVMASIVENLPELLGIDACTIRLLDPDADQFVLGAAAGESDTYLSRRDVDSAETMELVAAGRPVAMEDVATSPHRSFREAAKREGIVSVLTLPISYQGRVTGIMRLLTRRRLVRVVPRVSGARRVPTCFPGVPRSDTRGISDWRVGLPMNSG